MADGQAALAALERASEHDRAGRESKAIRDYARALELYTGELAAS